MFLSYIPKKIANLDSTAWWFTKILLSIFDYNLIDMQGNAKYSYIVSMLGTKVHNHAIDISVKIQDA